MTEKVGRGSDGRGAPTPSDLPCRLAAVLLGLVQWFKFGDTSTVTRTRETLDRLGVKHLRTGLSWADWYRGSDDDHEGRAWFDWLFEQFHGIELVPVIAYTPPEISVNAQSNGAPRDLSLYASFVRKAIEAYGRDWTHVELWNEPNGYGYWHRGDDPDWRLFAEMIMAAAEAAHDLGCGTVFPGASANDMKWYSVMAAHGATEPGLWDAAGLHAFPGSESEDGEPWRGWNFEIASVRAFGFPAVWVETGFSHQSRSGKIQAAAFEEAYEACERNDVARFYWYSLYDLPAHVPSATVADLGPAGWNAREYAMGSKPETLRAIRDRVRRAR